GMSAKVGPVYHEHRTEHPFLGQTLATEGGTSDATVHVIEDETAGILRQAMDSAKRIVSEHREALQRLVDHLLEFEGIEKADLVKVLGPGAARENPVEVVPAA
ncbi:MAG TPA: hypothetical protein VM686_28535, partial [Polyangiaceae bacterium]|nr:hypothetical protein [Polyangiaceae bacterium]